MDDAALLRDRYLFLRALRNARPDFWRGFRSSIQYGTSLEEWAESVGVVDPWFVEVLRDTRQFWVAHPDSDAAKLADGYEWFCWKSSPSVQAFSPTWKDPYLLRSGAPRIDQIPNFNGSAKKKAAQRFTVETLDAFCSRMRRQFDDQLKVYRGYLKKMVHEGQPGQRVTHAEWTALVFSGIKQSQIVRRWPNGHSGLDTFTVSKAVNRFAKDIGLTLPRGSSH